MIPPRPVFLYKPCGRIDYAGMRNAVTRGTKSSRQIRAEAERAARKAAEGPKLRGRALPPRELASRIE